MSTRRKEIAKLMSRLLCISYYNYLLTLSEFIITLLNMPHHIITHTNHPVRILSYEICDERRHWKKQMKQWLTYLVQQTRENVLDILIYPCFIRLRLRIIKTINTHTALLKTTQCLLHKQTESNDSEETASNHELVVSDRSAVLPAETAN